MLVLCQLVSISTCGDQIRMLPKQQVNISHSTHIGACSYLSSNISTEDFPTWPTLTALAASTHLWWKNLIRNLKLSVLNFKKRYSLSVLPLFGRLDFEQLAVPWLSRGFEPQSSASHLLCLQSYRHHLIHRDQHFCENMIGKTGFGLDLGFSFRGIWRHIS